jgi:hypothetical protein
MARRIDPFTWTCWSRMVVIVVFFILFIADADQDHLEKVDAGRQNFFPWQSRPNDRQRTTEGDHPPVFIVVPDFPPSRMIAILFSSLRIATRSLKMAVALGTNHTSCQAGGITRERMRRKVSLSRTGLPSYPTSKPLPFADE